MPLALFSREDVLYWEDRDTSAFWIWAAGYRMLWRGVR